MLGRAPCPFHYPSTVPQQASEPGFPETSSTPGQTVSSSPKRSRQYPYTTRALPVLDANEDYYPKYVSNDEVKVIHNSSWFLYIRSDFQVRFKKICRCSQGTPRIMYIPGPLSPTCMVQRELAESASLGPFKKHYAST